MGRSKGASLNQRPTFLLPDYAELATVSRSYTPPKGTFPCITHPCATLLTPKGFLVRLACIRHAASVRSEPGSNSNVETGYRNKFLSYMYLVLKLNHYDGFAIQFSKSCEFEFTIITKEVYRAHP